MIDLKSYGYKNGGFVNDDLELKVLRVGEIIKPGDGCRTAFYNIILTPGSYEIGFTVPADFAGYYWRERQALDKQALPLKDWACRSPACVKTTSPVGSPCWKCGRTQSSS